MPKKSRIRALLLGVTCSIVFLWLALHKINFRQTGLRLRELDLRYLLLLLAITGINLPLRSWRWQRIFPPHLRPGFWSCFQLLVTGNAINNVLPGRGGDLSRCLLVSRKLSLAGGSMALATLGIEKMLDALMMLVIILFSFWFLSPPTWMWQMCVISGSMLGGVLTVLYLLRYRSEFLLSGVRAMLTRIGLRRIADKVAELGSAFAEGLHVITSPTQMMGLLLMSAGIWATEGMLVYTVALSLHLYVHAAASLFVCAVLGLGLMIPAAPGSVGTYEFFSVAAMEMLGVNATNALAFTVVLHAWVFAANTAAGLIFGSSLVAGLQFSAQSASAGEADAVAVGGQK